MQPTRSSVARKRLALVALSSLWLAACGGGGGGSDVVATAPVPTGSSSPASRPSASGPAPAPSASAPAPSAGGTPAPQVSPPAASFAAFDAVVLATRPLGSVAATARLAGGGNVALWTMADPTVSRASTLMARLTNSAGQPVGDAFTIKAEVDTVTAAAVAASPDGGFLVVWAGFDAGFDPANQSASTQNLMARRYAANGTLVSETRLVANPQFAFRGIKVEPLAAGGYALGWTMQTARNAPGWGYLQRLDANGGPVGAPVAVFDSHSGAAAQESVTLAQAADGTVTAAWVDTPDTGTNTASIFARRFDASLQPLSAPAEVAGTTQPLQASSQPILVSAAPVGSSVALAWTVLQGGGTGIRSAVLAPGSTTPGAVASVTSTYPVVSLFAEALGPGSYGVIWQEFNASNIGAAGMVDMQRHDATGAATGAPVELNRRTVWSISHMTTSVATYNTIGVDAGPDGHVVVTGKDASYTDPTSPHVILVGR